MAVQGKGKRFGGRSKGTPNAITTQVRDMVMRAIELRGGVEYFIWAAENEPRSFLALAAKCIPQAIEGSVTVDHKFTLRDFTSLGDQNVSQKDPEVIDIQAEHGSGRGVAAVHEPQDSGSRLEIPIQAIDRGSIPVAVQSRGTDGAATEADR